MIRYYGKSVLMALSIKCIQRGRLCFRMHSQQIDVLFELNAKIM